MSRYIDAEKIPYHLLVNDETPIEGAKVACKCDIDKIPTADVVEVIRCKECKWWRPFPRGNYGDCILLFDRYAEDCESCFDAETECDGFCDKGERMDGGVDNG